MKKSLPLFILITVIIHIWIVPSSATWLSLISKIVPMFLIIFYALQQQGEKHVTYKRFLIIGLLFSVTADVGIEFAFIAGLVFFLLAHLCYIYAFWSVRKRNTWNTVMSLPLIAYALFIGYKMFLSLTSQQQDALVIPVFIYIAAICAMGWLSIVTGKRNALIGAMLFLLSDSILSWNLFVQTIPFASVFVMVTYYSAQFFIARSIAEK